MITCTIISGIKGRILVTKDTKILINKDIDTYGDKGKKIILFGMVIKLLSKITELAKQHNDNIKFNILLEHYTPYEGKAEYIAREQMIGAIKAFFIINEQNYYEFRNMDVVYKFKQPHKREKDNRKLFLTLKYPEFKDMINEELLLYSTALKMSEF